MCSKCKTRKCESLCWTAPRFPISRILSSVSLLDSIVITHAHSQAYKHQHMHTFTRNTHRRANTHAKKITRTCNGIKAEPHRSPIFQLLSSVSLICSIVITRASLCIRAHTQASTHHARDTHACSTKHAHTNPRTLTRTH